MPKINFRKKIHKCICYIYVIYNNRILKHFIITNNILYCKMYHIADSQKYYPFIRFIPFKTIQLSINYCGGSVDILTEIGKCFGGWLKENDCDEKDWIAIQKSA